MPEKYVGRKFKTVFTERKVIVDERVRQIIKIGKTLNGLNLTPENAGNISVRTENGMILTAGGKNKGSLTVEDFIEVVSFDETKKTAEVVGVREPSSEVPMHWLIYESFPDVGAVIHAHDSFVVEHPQGFVITGKKHPYGTISQAKDVIRALEKSNYIVIRQHGVIAVGKTLDEVLNMILKMYADHS